MHATNQLTPAFEEQLSAIARFQDPPTVLFIKLGTAGHKAEECFANNLLYIGYNTEHEWLRSLCNKMRDPATQTEAVERIRNYWLQKKRKPKAKATEYTNNLLRVAQDLGDTLW